MSKKVLRDLIKINFAYHQNFKQQGSRVTSKPRLYESLILKDVQNGIDRNYSKPVRAFSLYLFVPEVSQNVSFYQSFKLFIRISKTRGLTRWLCNNFFTTYILDPYNVSRLRLFTSIFLNWKQFSYLVLGSVLFTDKEIDFEDTLEISQFTHSYTNFTIRKKKYYKVEEDFQLKMKFSDRNSFINNFLFVMLVRSDSNLAKNIFFSSELLKNSSIIKQLIDLIPDLAREIDSVTKFDFDFAKFAELSFDERANELGSSSFDTLSNVEIWHQRFIIKSDKIVLIDETCSPNLDFVAGHWQYLEQVKHPLASVHLKKHLNPDYILLGEAIYLMGRADENWYHLLLDTFPRYMFMDGINVDVPVLIRSDLPNTSIEFLSRVIRRQIIQVSGKQIVKVKTLHFLAARSTTYDSPPSSGVDQVVFSPQTIERLRQYIFNSLPERILEKGPERLLLDRNSKYRRMLNYRKIRTVLVHYDFINTEVNENFFRNQYWIFNDAEIVVSQGGAIFANMIFMEPGSRIIVFRSTRDLKQSLWKKLARSSKVDITQCFGFPIYFGFNRLRRQHSDYVVSSILFKYTLRRILVRISTPK